MVKKEAMADSMVSTFMQMLSKLSRMLVSIRAVMNDAEQRQILEEAITTGPEHLLFLESRHFLFRHEIGSKIDEVIEKLENIAKEKEHLHLREGALGITINKARFRRPQTSSSRGAEHFWKDECRDGRIGKVNTLQLFYNDKDIPMHFDLRMWVCILEDFDLKLIIKAIIESATGAKFVLLDMDPKQKHLQRVIKEKKYLLVLDDV
ncbi:conserved hypothetical protein [Ricinus communis]|uniref:NB-ARC domain-containing protein n=1 Tax=Ricinus communis TaxID=3988 RepID=B9STA1_RICCO|nr:conserved hypothetical protein [Ricinus communis]